MAIEGELLRFRALITQSALVAASKPVLAAADGKEDAMWVNSNLDPPNTTTLTALSSPLRICTHVQRSLYTDNLRSQGCLSILFSLYEQQIQVRLRVAKYYTIRQYTAGEPVRLGHWHRWKPYMVDFEPNASLNYRAQL